VQDRATPSFGYTLSSEECPPRHLVRNAQRAEDAGFDFVSISDHFHPWVSAQGHSPFVWTVLGAIAEATTHVQVAVGVTCPLVRIHPAIVAQATATTALLFDGRFSLGLGTGEALNEHILGHRWPPADVRVAMLEEAVDVIRRLWSGDTVDHRGQFYAVENAKLFDPPDPAPPIIVSGFGPKAADLAARVGDGYWETHPIASCSSTSPRPAGAALGTPSSMCAGRPTRLPPARRCSRSGPTVASRASCRRICRRGRISKRRPTW
jgi:coenzyme F420-dependent glucose-6-phosphate dehydrogenase